MEKMSQKVADRDNISQTVENIEAEVEASPTNYLRKFRPTSTIRMPILSTGNERKDSTESDRGYKPSKSFSFDDDTKIESEESMDGADMRPNVPEGNVQWSKRVESLQKNEVSVSKVCPKLDSNNGENMVTVRACFFDVDGLLINTSDLHTYCHDLALERFHAPPLSWDIKAHMQGLPAAKAIDLLISNPRYAPYKIDQERYTNYLHIFNADLFPQAKALPGAEQLLSNLRSTSNPKTHLGLATGSTEARFKVKTQFLQPMFDTIPVEHRVFGCDPAIKGKGKPNPDIYLLALNKVNSKLRDGEEEIKPEECLVLEDGIAGVKAGLSAGMRVVWVPHPGLAKLYDIISNQSTSDDPFTDPKSPEERLAVLMDVMQLKGFEKRFQSRVTILQTLEDFPYHQFGIKV